MKLQTITLMAFLILACFTVPVHAQKDASGEIMKANENFMNLFNTGDVDKFITVYTDNARLLPPNGQVVTGKANLKTFWKGMMEAGIKPVLTTLSAQRYGKTAIEEGTVAIYAGDQVVDNVKYIVIWKKVNGTWKLHQDIWNSSTAVAGH